MKVGGGAFCFIRSWFIPDVILICSFISAVSSAVRVDMVLESLCLIIFNEITRSLISVLLPWPVKTW